MTNLSKFLEKCPLFLNLSALEIESMLSTIDYQIKSFKKEETVFSPCDPATTLGIILSGSIDIIKNFPSGKSLFIAKMNVLDLIAADSIFSDLNDYSETFLTTQTSKILFINKSTLTHLLHKNSTLFMNYLIAVSNSTITYKKCYGVLSLNSIQERICGYLYHEHLRTHSFTIKLPFSKKVGLNT